MTSKQFFESAKTSIKEAHKNKEFEILKLDGLSKEQIIESLKSISKDEYNEFCNYTYSFIDTFSGEAEAIFNDYNFRTELTQFVNEFLNNFTKAIQS